MEQVIIGGFYNALNVTATEYNFIMGGGVWSATVDGRAQTVSTPGKLKNLRVELDGVPGTGTYTFALRRAVGTGAWANTALTCTVGAGDTMASDVSNEVSVAAGDVIVLECNPDNPDNARNARWTIMFEGDNANESLLLLGSTAFAASDLFYPAMGVHYNTNEDNVRQVCPTSGVIKNLYVQLRADPGDTGVDGFTFTLRVNGADGLDGGNPLQVTVMADNRTGNDTTHEITVAAGDILTISHVRVDTPIATNVAIGMTFVADTNGESLIMGGTADDLSSSITEYMFFTSRAAIDTWTATEAQRYQLAQTCTLKKLYVLLNGSPGAGNNYTFTVRLEGASPGGGLVVAIANAATTGNDTSNEIAVSDGETVNMMVVPIDTPTVRDAYWGLVSFIETGVNVTIEPPLATIDSAGLVPTVTTTKFPTIVVPLATASAAGLVPTFVLEPEILVPLATVEATGLTPTTVIIYDLFYGYIESITPHPDPASQDCYISAIDGLDFLARHELDTVLYKDTLTGTLVTNILDASAWSASLRDIDAGQDIVPFAFWNKVKARFALGDIEDSELSFIIIDGAGKLAYEDRHHRYSATHQTSQATFDDTMVDISYNYSARNIFNEVRATVTPWNLESEATLWTLEEIPSIPAGETVTWWGDAAVDGIPVFVDAWVTPASTTDYTANSQSDGGGVDKTSDITIVTTKFAESIKLVITNDDSQAVFITALKARGTYYNDLTKVSRKTEDSTSQTAYQKRTLALDGKYLTDADKAQDFCDYGIARFKDPQAEVVITIVNKNAANLTQILAREISDRITAKNTDLGLDSDFFINKMEHEITEGGHRHLCRWYLVDASNEDFWSLGFSELGTGTKLGY